MWFSQDPDPSCITSPMSWNSLQGDLPVWTSAYTAMAQHCLPSNHKFHFEMSPLKSPIKAVISLCPELPFYTSQSSTNFWALLFNSTRSLQCFAKGKMLTLHRRCFCKVHQNNVRRGQHTKHAVRCRKKTVAVTVTHCRLWFAILTDLCLISRTGPISPSPYPSWQCFCTLVVVQIMVHSSNVLAITLIKAAARQQCLSDFGTWCDPTPGWYWIPSPSPSPPPSPTPVLEQSCPWQWGVGVR